MIGRYRRTGLSLAGLLLFFAAWEGLARSGLVSALLVPPPSRVPAAWIAEMRSGTWFGVVVASLTHYLAGLLLGSAAGIALGVATALSERLDDLLAWVVRTLRPIPAIA